MKKILMVLVILGISVAVIASEPVQHRILVHGTQSLTEKFSIAGWVIFPDIRQGTQTVALIGPRIDFKNAWIELLAGITPDDHILFDARFFFKLSPKFHVWGEGQISEDGALYEFIQADIPIQIQDTFFGKIGIEVEASQKRGTKPQFGWGPHLIIPVGKMTFVIAHQWKDKKSFSRIYTVLEF